MSSGDLISFLGDSSQSPAPAPFQAPEAEGSLPQELAGFDPLMAPPSAPSSPSKASALPDAIAAAFANVGFGADSHPCVVKGEPLIGTWNFKKDPAALKEFDVQSLVERTQDGLRIVEGEASGALQESGEWFQASLPTGVVRLRLTETHDIVRDFKSSASAPWEGELVGHIGFNQSQAAALMSLGVGEAAARYSRQRSAEEEE